MSDDERDLHDIMAAAGCEETEEGWIMTDKCELCTRLGEECEVTNVSFHHSDRSRVNSGACVGCKRRKKSCTHQCKNGKFQYAVDEFTGKLVRIEKPLAAQEEAERKRKVYSSTATRGSAPSPQASPSPGASSTTVQNDAHTSSLCAPGAKRRRSSSTPTESNVETESEVEVELSREGTPSVSSSPSRPSSSQASPHSQLQQAQATIAALEGEVQRLQELLGGEDENVHQRNLELRLAELERQHAAERDAIRAEANAHAVERSAVFKTHAAVLQERAEALATAIRQSDRELHNTRKELHDTREEVYDIIVALTPEAPREIEAPQCRIAALRLAVEKNQKEAESMLRAHGQTLQRLDADLTRLHGSILEKHERALALRDAECEATLNRRELEGRLRWAQREVEHKLREAELTRELAIRDEKHRRAIEKLEIELAQLRAQATGGK